MNGYSERVQKQLHCAVRWYAHRDNDKAAGGKDGDEGCVTEARESPAHGAYNSHLSPCVLNPFACNYILYQCSIYTYIPGKKLKNKQEAKRRMEGGNFL